MTNAPRKRRWALLAMTGVLAAGTQLLVQAVTAGPAAAVAGITMVSGTTVTNDKDHKEAVAVCPSGKRVVGGGGLVADGNAKKVRLIRLEPVDTGQAGYFIAGAAEPEEGFDGDWRVIAYAYCADPMSGYQVVPGSSEQSTSTFKEARAVCPAGKQVIGTGGRIDIHHTRYSQAGLQLSRASGPLDIVRTTGREDANGYSGVWHVTSFAVCADPVGAYAAGKLVTGDSANTSCPLGMRVHGLGGGGGLQDGGPEFLRGLYPIDNYRFGAHLTGPLTEGLVVSAVCAP